MTSSTRLFLIALTAAGLVGCGTKSNDTRVADTVPTAKQPGSAPAATPDAGAEVKTYTFHGTPKSIDASTKVVTVDHEAVDGYKPAGVDQFTASSDAVLGKLKVGTPTHLTVRVLGEQALITEAEEEHEEGGGH